MFGRLKIYSEGLDPSPEKGYVSLSSLKESLYTNWAERAFIGSEYRELSSIVTKRGHWNRKLKKISRAVDSLGRANKSELRYLDRVRNALVEYRENGYLKRSMRECLTSEELFNGVTDKIERYIFNQSLRIEQKKVYRRTAAAAGLITVTSAVSLFSSGHKGNYNLDIEALRILRNRPVAAASVEQGEIKLASRIEFHPYNFDMEPINEEAKPTEKPLPETEIGYPEIELPGILDDLFPDPLAEEEAREKIGPIRKDYDPRDSKLPDSPEPGQERGRMLIEGEGLPITDDGDSNTYTIVLGGDAPQIEPREPTEDELICWKNMPQDMFRELKTKSLEPGCTEAELLMAVAAEMYARNWDNTAYELYGRAISLDPEVDGRVVDSDHDGLINTNDMDLAEVIERDIAISNFYLNKANAELEGENELGALLLTYPALMYNGEAMDDVEEIRGQCDIGTAVFGDIIGYGDWLLFDGEVTYQGERIKPYDTGVHPANLGGSLEFTGHNAGELLGDTVKTAHGLVNTVVGTGDRVVCTAINGVGNILGKIFNPDVDHDAAFAENMAKVNERTASGYGSNRSYIGKPIGVPLEDMWKIGNNAVNTAGGVLMTLYNTGVRLPLEAGGSVIGGENGFKTMHEVSGIGQIPIAAITDNFPVFGSDEPKKAQSNAIHEIFEDLSLTDPTIINMLDRDMDGVVTKLEFFASLPGIQGLFHPEDNYSTMMQRIIRWLLNTGQLHLIFDHDDNVGVCTEPGRGGGGPGRYGRDGGGPGNR